MSYKYDLITERWLPLITLSGEQDQYSLVEALTKAHTFRELYDASPLVTAAILRFLLAVLYCCFPAESRQEFESRWAEIWKNKCFPEREIVQYLTNQQKTGHFDLFDEVNPFFQVGGMSMAKSDSARRLIL